MPESVIGLTLDDKYKIEKQLGKGGMGTVYLATHIGTERPVAVKVIASEFMKRAEFIERFRREARAAGRLRHPNVVDVTDFGFSDTDDGEVAFLVMEYLDGCTLGEILKEEKNLPLSWTVDIIEQVCSAVHEAHTQGIIHRDLKPDNIWLEPNQRGGYTVKVLDFGIAKLEESHAIITDETDFKAILDSEVKSIGGRETIADAEQILTFAEKNNLTLVSESATLALNEGTKNFDSEAGTLIQSDEVDSEDGTAIFPADQTKLLANDENAVTKIISEQIKTDKSYKNTVGTAKSLLNTPSTAELTRVGAVLGTPLYMSPEQCKGDKLTPHSDIYSLGIIAYQMLSGKTPFTGDHSEVMEAHKEIEAPALDAKKIPKKVKQVINAALSKKTEERPPTAEAFASEMRASSEGFGSLLRRSLVIYSENITKFLQVAFLLAIPGMLLTFANAGLRLSTSVELLSDNVWLGILSVFLSFVNFFIQIGYVALLVGMTTWIVAQALAAPLRPIRVRETFRQVGKGWKPLLKTVTLSTLLSLLSWVLGAIGGTIISAIICIPVWYFTGNWKLVIGIATFFGILGAAIFGVIIASAFMLIAPSITMEGVKGRAAFRRSVELVKRSFRTVLATAISIYVIPPTLAIIIALSINGMMNSFDPPKKSTDSTATEQTETPKDQSDELNISLDGKGLRVTNDKMEDANKDRSTAGKLRESLQQGLYEILWLPISILMVSFTSVITALLYFKTRQAGGESMQELLQQFEDEECPRTNWQSHVRERFLQSGRTTTGKKITTNKSKEIT